MKFRAWSKSQNKMLYRVLAGDTETDSPCSLVWDDRVNDWVNFDRFCGDIMQFTGVKDREGNDIYEGDIINIQYSLRLAHVEIKKENIIAAVEFRNGCFCWLAENKKDYMLIHNDCKVVGNIYENQDLLIT